MTTTHTPGPWQATPNIEYGSYGPTWTIRFDKQKVVAGISGAGLHCGREQAEANARLIAAAPDLLDLLETAIARVELANAEGNPILSAWLPDAKAAAARVRGEQA
jgi:hypothetical protein